MQSALESVRDTGYGVVVPELDEIQIEDPSVIRQGSKFGVKIKSKSPSVHMIKAEIETEIAPIVGTEQQAKDLIEYIGESRQRGESIWETNIFGKSIEQLVQDGIRSKIASIGEESQVKIAGYHAENCQRQQRRHGLYYHLNIIKDIDILHSL